MLQSLIVGMIVMACATFATWSLMPAAARRKLATAILKLPLPAPFAGPFQRSAKAASGCGCDGCDHAPDKARKIGKNSSADKGSGANAAPASAPITFHRRVRR